MQTNHAITLNCSVNGILLCKCKKLSKINEKKNEKQPAMTKYEVYCLKMI